MSDKILVIRGLPSIPEAYRVTPDPKTRSVRIWASPGDEWEVPQSIGVFVQILNGSFQIGQVFLTLEQAEELAIGILYAKRYAETDGKPEINA